MSIEVSVVIPIYNEEQYISKCLQSLILQDFPKNKLEILVVDGESIDNSRKIIETYKQKYSFIRILNNPDKIIPSAMNIGIESAKGNFIIRVDAHCEYDCTYISTCLEYLRKTSADNVGGPMRAKGINYIGKAIAAVHYSFFGMGGGKFHDEKYEGFVDTVYLGAFRKSIFRQIGLYNNKLVRNQDIELNSRIIKHGGKIYLTPKIKSYYYNRSSLKEFWKQNLKNGQWNVYTTLVNRKALSLRHFIPFIFISFLLLFLILSLFSLTGKILLIIILTIYILFSIFCSIWTGLTRGIQYIPILPVVYAILHFSYGIGFIWGFLTINKWASFYLH